MSVIVVGLSHRTAPVGLLERASLPSESLPALIRDAVTSSSVAEAAVLSTCNRVEVYAEVARFHPSVADLSALLALHTGVALDELTPHLYVHYDERAVEHLFTVACGLDSMVVGEGQILGQVRTALRVAQDSRGAGRVLNELLQQALRVGKRAHTDTGLDRAGASLVSVGLELAASALDGLAGRRALVVGAGSMSALAATSLARLGVGSVVVANRTPEHGTRLAAAVGGTYRSLDDLDDALAEADVVVSCTGAVGTVVTTELVSRSRRGFTAPLVLVDLALPHDVEVGVRALPGVTLIDLERLADLLADGPAAQDVDTVRGIVAAETETFLAWERASAVAPTVVALRAMADGLVTGELARLAGRLPELDERSREEVAQAVRRVVDKLLHSPTIRVKELAGAPGGQAYASALRALFDLDTDEPSARLTPPALEAEPARPMAVPPAGRLA